MALRLAGLFTAGRISRPERAFSQALAMPRSMPTAAGSSKAKGSVSWNSRPLDAARRAKMIFRTSADRLAGYAEAIAAAGLDPDAMPTEERPASSEANGRDAGLALLRRPDRPTAILAMSDRLAIGVIEAARSLNLRVPQDVSVAGFDDIPRAALVRPALTTIRQPLFDKGATAASLLLGAVADGGTIPADRRLLPTELVVRASTRPPE